MTNNQKAYKKLLLQLPSQINEIIETLPNIDARKDECYDNVKKYICDNGGKLIYGWLIHETPIMIEAVAHGIWESPSRKRYCITLNKQFEEIKFIEDSSLNGLLIDNKRELIIDNEENKNLIKLYELIFKINKKLEEITISEGGNSIKDFQIGNLLLDLSSLNMQKNVLFIESKSIIQHTKIGSLTHREILQYIHTLQNLIDNYCKD
jgi:hypothetical protein